MIIIILACVYFFCAALLGLTLKIDGAILKPYHLFDLFFLPCSFENLLIEIKSLDRVLGTWLLIYQNLANVAAIIRMFITFYLIY